MTILSDELTNDPLARGYSGMTDQQAADSLNLTVDRDRNRTSMSGREVAAEVVDSEYDALTDIKKSQLLSLLASADLDPFGLAANVVKDIFGGGSSTITALLAVRVETVNRATELGLSFIWPGNVEQARAS